MTSRWVSEVVENALGEARDLVPELLANTVDADTLLVFCANLRIAAIGDLFLTGTSERFLRRLQTSAKAFAAGLPRVRGGARLTSRSSPFFDALASADWAAAAAIATASNRSWVTGEEYEEDFLFPEFLMQSFFLHLPSAEAGAVLDRWDGALQGSEDHRLGVCRALITHDADGFNASLEAFLTARKDDNDQVAEGSVVPEETLATAVDFSVEGLALVRLAERAGIATKPDYLHVPSIARENPTFTLDAAAWRQVD
jgi:hypothetical protein